MGPHDEPRMGINMSIIREDMSDLAIVNEIIKVVGYEHLEVILDMLEDRLNHVRPNLAKPEGDMPIPYVTVTKDGPVITDNP